LFYKFLIASGHASHSSVFALQRYKIFRRNPNNNGRIFQLSLDFNNWTDGEAMAA
jgi:hypothetical protein